MKITDILTNYDWYTKSSFFSHDFEELEDELTELIEEIDEVSGSIGGLSELMLEIGCDGYAAYEMELFDDFMFNKTPLEITRELWLDEFNPRECYFSYNEIWGIYSGNNLDDFEELDTLDNTLLEVKAIASAVIDYINGEYFEGVENVEGVEGEVLRSFAQWLSIYNEGLKDDYSEYSAAVMAQM